VVVWVRVCGDERTLQCVCLRKGLAVCVCLLVWVRTGRDRVSAYEVGEMVCLEVNGTSEASTHSTGVQDEMYDVMPWGSDGPSG
jgi:hypothetical protein